MNVDFSQLSIIGATDRRQRLGSVEVLLLFSSLQTFQYFLVDPDSRSRPRPPPRFTLQQAPDGGFTQRSRDVASGRQITGVDYSMPPASQHALKTYPGTQALG